jgi:guanylate kinase
VSRATRLVVLSGPTAVGKGTVVAALRTLAPDIWVSVSATTRSPRPGEINGVHYLFVSNEEFDAMVEHDDFLEWAVVHTQARYGTPRQQVASALAQGRPALLEIDLQGARQVREAMPEALFVFLEPPSWEELNRRLVGRGTETPQEQQLRLATAVDELDAKAEFDRVIVNSEVQQAAKELVDLVFEVART